jgi:hypothetical protein
MISPFSALSTGLDLVEGKTDDLWPLICQSRDHLYAQMVMLRFVFSYGEGSYEEAIQGCTLYGKALGITLDGILPWEKVPCKLLVALAFWLMKQHRLANGVATLQWSEVNPFLRFSSPSIKEISKEDEIVQKGTPPRSPQETLAAYVHTLLGKYHKSLTLCRKQGVIEVFIDHHS